MYIRHEVCKKGTNRIKLSNCQKSKKEYVEPGAADEYTDH